MRICIISKFLEGIHSQSGGMERHVNDLVNNLDKDITIITSKHPKGLKEDNIGKNKVYFVDAIPDRNPLNRIKFFKEVANMLNELDYGNKFDILHIQSDFGIGIFNYIDKRIPVVTTLHGTLYNDFIASIKYKPWLLPIWLLFYNLYKSYELSMLKNSDQIICVSNMLKKSIIDQRNVYKNKLNVIHNGIDTELFKPIKKFKKFNYDLLYVGSLIYKKGVHLLINVMPDLIKYNSKIKLNIIGNGPYRKTLENIVKQKNLENHVFFLGRKNKQELVEYYNKASLTIMPTLFVETFPYVILESMACDTPVIASNVGGIPEIITDSKKGILTDLNSKTELLKNITEYFKYNSTYKLSEYVVNNFSIKYMILNTAKIYNKV